MLALRLTDIKDFMNKFLRSETFDHFLLQEGVITSCASYVIDGHIHSDCYTSEEMEELEIADCDFLPYGLLRGNCFDLIKGKQTPSSVKFVLLLSPQNLERTLSSIQSSFTGNDITGVFLNIRFHNQQLSLTTGISYRIFSVDKTLDNEWDRLVKKLLNQKEITQDEL